MPASPGDAAAGGSEPRARGTVTARCAVTSRMTSWSGATSHSPAQTEPSALVSQCLPPRLFPLGLDDFFFLILIPDYFTDPRLPNKIHLQLIKEKKAAHSFMGLPLKVTKCFALAAFKILCF